MASLKKIEALITRNEKQGLPTKPWWTGGDYKGRHMSGLLREIADLLPARDVEVILPDGSIGLMSTVLMDAAECLDDAFEEWLEDQNLIARAREALG